MIILRNKSAITQHYDDYLTGQLELGLTVVDTKSVSKFQFPSQIDSFRHERHERYSRPTVQRSRWGQSALTMHCMKGVATTGKLKYLFIQLGNNKSNE